MKLLNTSTFTSVLTVYLCTKNVHQSESFIFSRIDVNPNLSELAKAQTGTLLNIGLDIKNPKSLSQLYVDGLTLELKSNAPSKDNKQCISLPGGNGAHPELSTGPLHMKMKSEGKFVSIHGTQSMNIENGAWEMVWAADRHDGTIICGFHLNQALIRNDAVLPSGKIFMSFRVWTSHGLHEARNDKMMYEQRFSKHSQEQKDALDNMNSTDNPIMKAMHFRNAAAANEMLSVMHTNRFETVPSGEEDVITVGDGLLVAKQGSIWTTVREQSLLGKKDMNIYLGGAVLK